MKQIIILFSTILLGIAISGFVMELKDSAKGLTDESKLKLEKFVEDNQ